MRTRPQFYLILLLTVVISSWAAQALHAAPAPPFYKGKMIRIIVGYSPGGGFDTFARLVARHLGNHIPGKPSVIVQNMPGAGSLLAANKVYSTQPGDGLSMVIFQFGLVSQALTGDPTVKFDPSKYIWLGDPTIGGVPQVLWVRSALPIRSLKDLRDAPEPLALGATGVGTAAGAAAEFLRSLGFQVRNVYGYRGTRNAMVALDKKELDGKIMSQANMQTVYRRYVDDGLLRPIVALGDEPRLKPIPGVATLKDLNLTPDQQKIADFLIDSSKMLRVFAVPPGTPPERVEILRQAFVSATKDPKLLQEAERQGVIVSPASGEEVANTVRQLAESPPEVIEEYKKLIGLKNR